MEKIIEYSNGEVTVVWKPNICIHSAKCVNGNPDVFKPKEKPWVQVNNAKTKAIINTVKECPSGALSYYLNDKKPKVEGTIKNAQKTKVEVVNNGPLLIHGGITIDHADGTREEKTRTTAFCRCAKSSNKPFCDGSHNM